jgi:hypothetical protein
MIAYESRIYLLIAVTTSPLATTSEVMMAEPLLPSFNSTFRLGCLAISLLLTSPATACRSTFPSSKTMELSSRRSSV